MEYSEFKRHLGKAGVSINDYALLLHVRASSISNYAKKGVVPQQHALLSIVLGDAGDRGVDFRALFRQYGVFPARTQEKVAVLESYRKPQDRRRPK